MPSLDLLTAIIGSLYVPFRLKWDTTSYSVAHPCWSTMMRNDSVGRIVIRELRINGK